MIIVLVRMNLILGPNVPIKKTLRKLGKDGHIFEVTVFAQIVCETPRSASAYTFMRPASDLAQELVQSPAQLKLDQLPLNKTYENSKKSNSEDHLSQNSTSSSSCDEAPLHPTQDAFGWTYFDVEREIHRGFLEQEMN